MVFDEPRGGLKGWDYCELAEKWGLSALDDDPMGFDGEGGIIKAIRERISTAIGNDEDDIILDMVEFLKKLSENEESSHYSVVWEAILTLAPTEEQADSKYVFFQMFWALLPLMWT